MNYLHDSNSIFWAQGIKSEWVSGGTVRVQRVQTGATLEQGGYKVGVANPALVTEVMMVVVAEFTEMTLLW